MKLTKTGKKNLWFKVSCMISFAWKNCKLELLLIALAIIWVNLSWRIPNLNQILEDYFSESRCSGIAGFTSIVIGIYITIWSIFATSASKINAELLKSRIEGQLFFLIGIDLIEALLTTVLCVFVPSGISYYAELIALFTALTVVSFAKFIILIMIITKLNITYIVQEIDEQNAKCIESQVKTDEIYQRIVNAKK